MKNYETISIIKQNAKGLVCLASTPEFDRPIIVKERKSANPAIYEQLAQLENIHIPKLYSCETEGDTTIIMEEYVEGECLDAYVKMHSCTESGIVELILQVCECMGQLHNQTPPIIHRDLKPENILVTKEGLVKIIDFDASRNFDAASNRDTRLLGTEGYAPPEQFGYAQTDARSDIYAIGVILYELIFDRSFPLNHASLSKNELYPLAGATGLARRLVPEIEKCTKFHPGERYADTAQLERALRRALKYNPARLAAFSAAALVLAVCLAAGIIYRIHMRAVETAEITATTTEDFSEYDNFTTYIVDSFDAETNTSVPRVAYYLQNDPAQPPFYFSFRLDSGETPHSVILEDNTDGTMRIISPEYFQYGAETGLLYISDKYLSRLKPDREYTLSCLFSELRWQLQFYPLSSLDKLDYSEGALVSPGYFTYDRENPRNYYAAAFNAFGRKITGVYPDDMTEPLDPQYCSISEDGSQLTVFSDFFEQYASGDVFYLYIEFEEDTISDDNALRNIYIEIM